MTTPKIPKQSKVKKAITEYEAKARLWELGELSWKLKGKQIDIYNHFKKSEQDIDACLISRQFGKCLHEDTDIITANRGMVKIKDITTDDKVFSYNSDGSIKVVPVKQVHYQGKKEVVELLHNNVVIERCTLDHRFLVYNRVKNDYLVKEVKNFRTDDKIVRIFTPLENNSSADYMGVKIGKSYMAETYDIGIDTEDHLYLTANGLVTHNSFTLLVLVTEVCVRYPNTIVKYACPKQKMVERVIRPRMRDICIDAPRHLAPEWIPSEKVFRFPNGSEIQVAGTDNGHYDSLRGGTAHLCVVDEAGFCDELETIVYSVLAPTTDTTNGKIWLASTPNDEDPAHDFHEFFVNPMKASGSLLEMSFYDSPMLDDKKRQKIIERYHGGEANVKFRCEYLVEIPRATESTVIPEFYANRDSIIIKEYTLPPFYDAYVSMDVGFKDLTAALFAYYDFNEACLYIIDEIITNGPEMTTQSLATDIKHKERIHFVDPLSSEIKTPYMRVMDNDLKLINDLARLHELYFIPTAKDKKEVAINQLRMWLSNGRIKIHERCKHTIYHLENVLWTKNRSEFARLKDSPNSDIRGGHADAADAAIYMVRAINEYNNPFPSDHLQLKGPNVHRNSSKTENTSSIKELMMKLMNLK